MLISYPANTDIRLSSLTSIPEQAEQASIREYEDLFKANYAPLVRYAFTFIHDEDEAEDIVQQVFVEVWRKESWKTAHTSARAMLYTAVKNTSINRLKRLKVRDNFANEQLRSELVVEHEMTEANELHRLFLDALEKLPEECRRIFRLNRFEQKKYREIADELNLSIKTVENQMGKALRILREHLKDFLVLFIFLLMD